MASPSDSQKTPHSFPHHTSSAAPRRPFLDTSTPAINAAPVELDSTPVSPVAKQHSWPTNRPHDAAAGDKGDVAAGAGQRSGISHGENQGLRHEAGDGKALSQEEIQRRDALLKKRSQDPAIVVDVPEGPGADELALAIEEEAQRKAQDRQ